MRATLDPMPKRLFALVVALAVVSAPVALEVCQIRCDSKRMSPSMLHSAHANTAHHDMLPGHAGCHEHDGTAQQLSPANGRCDHGTEATPSLAAARNSETSISLLATIPASGSILLVAARAVISVRESVWSVRLEIPLAIPLRV
jgi:hypothetical protein